MAPPVTWEVTSPIAFSWASRKLTRARVISTPTAITSARATAGLPDSDAKRCRTQSPGVTKPSRNAAARSFGASAWKTTMIDIMKPVAMMNENPLP